MPNVQFCAKTKIITRYVVCNNHFNNLVALQKYEYKYEHRVYTNINMTRKHSKSANLRQAAILNFVVSHTSCRNKAIVDSRLRPQSCCHLANCIEMQEIVGAKAVPLANPAKCLNVIIAGMIYWPAGMIFHSVTDKQAN